MPVLKIQIASDLHLESWRGEMPDEQAFRPAEGRDLLVLAGDIHVGTKCFRRRRYLLRPLRLLPAGATVAERDSHLPGNGTFPRRTEIYGLRSEAEQRVSEYRHRETVSGVQGERGVDGSIGLEVGFHENLPVRPMA